MPKSGSRCAAAGLAGATSYPYVVDGHAHMPDRSS